MKKISSILLAVLMLAVLCVPAFAGDAIIALNHKGAKQIAVAIAKELDTQIDEETSAQDVLADEHARKAIFEKVLLAITMDDFSTAAYREEAAKLAAEAVAADYSLTSGAQESLRKNLVAVLDDAYVGVAPFDKEEIPNNIAGSFSDKDLDALFGTLKNTVTDLSDRVSGVLRETGIKLGGTDNSGSGMTDATGDTAVYAVLGVAAVAGVALVVASKKQKSSK